MNEQFGKVGNYVTFTDENGRKRRGRIVGEAVGCDCPEDDTCDCPLVMSINKALIKANRALDENDS